MSWDVTSDVQSFINGINPNYGWKITDENYWGSGNIPYCLFKTKETGVNIPYLEIEWALNNPPNTPNKPIGPSYAWAGAYIEFSTNATDPDNDQIKYGWDWNGDNTVEQWTTLIPSGNTCNKQHK
jgi:hypothetical protein